LLVNAATDQHRRRRRLRAIVSLIPDPQPDRDFAIDVAQSDELRNAFERLRLEHRVVLVLHHYLDLSAVEIADILEVPAGTVKSRLHYGAVAMRAAVDAGTRAPASAATDESRR
jgi:RNA polymerase sigma-70 factor (ECF subfamily)